MTLLLAFNFPPQGGGIARWMGELALRYPPGCLMVSTGRHPASQASDPGFPQPIDHAPIRAKRLRTLNGLVLWTARAGGLVRRAHPGFAWCAELKPAAYPARWLRARYGLPYGVMVHGTELLLLDAKLRRSRFKRWTARELLGGAAVVVANSRWTADLARALLGALGRPALAADVRVVPLGTEPETFRPGIDPRPARETYGLDGGPWLLTVSRVEWHKGIDMVIRALPAARDRKSTRLNSSHRTISYAVFCLKKKNKQQHTPIEVAAYACLRCLRLPLLVGCDVAHDGCSARIARESPGDQQRAVIDAHAVVRR